MALDTRAIRIGFYHDMYHWYWHVRWIRFWTELGWAYEADCRRNKRWL